MKNKHKFCSLTKKACDQNKYKDKNKNVSVSVSVSS